MILILGLTGLIGSGKTTISNIFRNYGVDVFNSDLYVKQLMQKKKIQSAIAEKFPKSIENGIFSKKALREIVFSNYKQNIGILEEILHPYVKKKIIWIIFLKRILFFWKKKVLLLEVPLLFESGINEICDYSLLVSCKASSRIQRVIKRDNISLENLKEIMLKQSTEEYLSVRVDFIITNSDGQKNIEEQVINVLKQII